ncbi:MAG: ABC transporter ATP-binding protein [Lachnospiraceae bacterium]|nr:ABC transporter ATP-binding protein [Lachnospiraceae bacterium]
MKEIIKAYRKILTGRQKRMCVLLLILLFIASLLECVGLSLVIPALTSISEPDKVIRILLLMCGVYCVKNIYLSAVTYFQLWFTGKNRLMLQKVIIGNLLRSPYLYHARMSTPELIQHMDGDIRRTFDLLNQLLHMCSEFMMVAVLSAFLFVVNPMVTVIIFAFYLLLMGGIQVFIKPYLAKESEKSWLLTNDFNKWLLQTVNCIKIVKAEKKEPFFTGKLLDSVEKSCKMEVKTTYIRSIPRMILEMGTICGMLLAVSLFVNMGVGTSDTLSSLAVFAVVAIRMLPCMSRINNALNGKNWLAISLRRTMEVLDGIENAKQEGDGEPEGEVTSALDASWGQLVLDKVSFRYPDTEELVLEELDLTVKAGTVLGITGLSGAGKTTLVDMMLGLLEPLSGEVMVGGVNIYHSREAMNRWAAQIAYIPQNVSLLDGSIRENVLFGLEHLGDESIWAALEAAQLKEYVQSLPDGLDTYIGQWGVRLSGGQRQRIGIARAFYKQADVLVLDEATSALDYATEQKIMDMVGEWRGKKTVVIITHRQEALGICDEIIAISGKKAKGWIYENTNG